ncbi:MAG: tail fiber domain-containing protein [Muribaculaceae bacterium]|nr:tail fiber domain-containing protein [Muribaculaceae bacterium]
MTNIIKLALAATVAVMATSSIDAQICVKPEGRVQLGNWTYEDNFFAAHPEISSPDTVTTVKLFGYNPAGAGARLSFGDQFTRNTDNVVIGELGRHDDTDQLWLHGKQGIYHTERWGDTIFYCDHHKDYKFHFNCDVVVDGVFNGSDARFKHDVSQVKNGLDIVEQLNAVTYKLYPRFTQANADKLLAEYGDIVDPTGKLQIEKEEFSQYYAEMENQPARFGFIAQEVEEVLPELVHTDKAGYKYVDYIGVIPLLVNAIQELRAELAEVKGEEPQQAPSHAPRQTSGDDAIADGLLKPALYQNAPNPFNAETRIRYCLPESVVQADLYIYDLQGKQVKKIAVTERGESSVTIHGSELQAGMYIYALIADGQEIDSKRMILTK